MNIQTFNYNRAYFPAAPFVEVTVNTYEADAKPVIISAQIDSGADATMMPVSVLEEIGALFEATRPAIDFSGQRHIVDLYAASVNLAGQTFYLSVIAQENTSEAVIGRDILNDLVVTLNGPAHVTEIQIDDDR